MTFDMSFFANEKSSSRLETRQFSYRTDNNAMLRRDFTIDGQSGLYKSPYELFRENVANYCDRYMLDSFAPTDCMSAEEKASCAYRNCIRKSPGHVCDYDEDESTLDINDIPSRDPSSATTDKSAFSVLSVSFEPADKDEPNKKISFLKRISKLMNNYSSNKMSLTQHAELKQHQSPHQWSACECHVHIGKHSNCCQCQEPYHRTGCDCVQHSGSHSYCCRCDIHLLQQYDQYLKKKKYLRLYSGEDDISSPNSSAYLNNVNPSRPSTSQTDKSSWCEDRGLFTQDFFNESTRCPRPGICEFPKENNDYQTRNSERTYSWKKECDTAQFHNVEDHPCESCCKKLDDVYGSALREVHSMLVDVSRSLAPSMNCCTLDGLIKDTFIRQKPLHNSSPCSQDHRRSVEIQEAPVSERPSYSLDESITYPRILNRQSDVAIQVNTYSQEPTGTPREKRSKNSLTRKIFKKEKIKEKCVIS